MNTPLFPPLDSTDLADTRDALHAYARILGGWTKACRAHRKHWWHASLRPSLGGISTGVLYAGVVSFELDLHILHSQLRVRTNRNKQLDLPLNGQAAGEVSAQITWCLRSAGVPDELAASATEKMADDASTTFEHYSPAQASDMALSLHAVVAAMEAFRAGLREEASPIQMWPHHFDLSMLWLPGETIKGKDPQDAEQADKQLNFGFVFGDQQINEPYFYVTAYPSLDEFAELDLPPGSRWQSDGFNGVVLAYQTLRQKDDPTGYLLQLWTRLLNEGRALYNID